VGYGKGRVEEKGEQRTEGREEDIWGWALASRLFP